MGKVTPSQVSKSRKERDMQEIIRAVLRSPLSSGRCYDVDGNTPVSKLLDRNTDIQTRMLLAIAGQAMNGDVKSAQFLMKYGGFEPDENKTITIEVPRFVDDVSGVPDPEFPTGKRTTALPPPSDELVIDAAVTILEDERWP